MDSGDFITVLGHARVLAGPLADARRRVLAHDGDVVVGVASFDPLFGHQAEGAIAVADGSPTGVISYLFDGLLERARASDVTVLRYVLAATGRQHALAARLTAACSGTTRLHADRLELHLEAAPPLPLLPVGVGAGSGAGTRWAARGGSALLPRAITLSSR